METTQKISKILSIIVMKQELDEIISKEKYDIDEEFTSMHKEILTSYKKEYIINDSKLTSIILTGKPDPLHNLYPVGTEIAFLLSYLGTKHYNPDCIVSTGYSGSSGLVTLKKGDVIISKGFGHYYLRECIMDYYLPVIKGNYPVFDSTNIGKELGFIPGQIGTSDSFLATDGGKSKENGITCIEMEFAAISRIGFYLNTPLIGLKIISDGEDDNESDRQGEFKHSLTALGAKIENAYLVLIKYLATLNKNSLS